MKILLVADKIETLEALTRYFGPRGFDFIHYQSPIKAMDNIDEIAPPIVVFSAEDFPRHWKPFIRFLRRPDEKEQTSFILLKGSQFSFEEASKANHLGVNGIVKERLDDRHELAHLEELFYRYSAMRDMRSEQRYLPEEFDTLEFVFSHPVRYAMVTGKLMDISGTGATFMPDDPRLTADIPSGQIIPYCSLKLGDQYLSLTCKVIRNQGRMAFHFENIQEDERNKIIDYIDRRSERELQMILHGD